MTTLPLAQGVKIGGLPAQASAPLAMIVRGHFCRSQAGLPTPLRQAK
jgi:hypothetical protein